MNTIETMKLSSQSLPEITVIGMKAVKRVNDAIEKNKTDTLNIDAEKILSRDIQATVNSIKAEVLAYRVINNRLS